jgi:hypothetical protein
LRAGATNPENAGPGKNRLVKTNWTDEELAKSKVSTTLLNVRTSDTFAGVL